MLAQFQKHQKKATIIAVVIFVVMMIVPITLIGVYSATYGSLTAQEVQKQQTLTDLGALALKIKLDTLVGIASSMAASPTLSADANAGRWSDAINVARDLQNNVSFYDPFIDRVGIYDASGTQRAAYPSLTGGLGTSASNFDWYKVLSSGQKTSYLTNVTRRASFPQIQVVNIVLPVKYQNMIVGYFMMQIPTEHFLEFGENLALGTYGFAYVVDPAGNIIAHPKFYSDATGIINYTSVPQVQEVIAGNSGTDIISDNTNGEKSLVTYKPVESYKWGIVTQELYSEAFSTRTGILLELKLLIGSLIAINILIAYMVFRVVLSQKHE